MLIDLINKITIYVGKRNSGKSILMKYMIEQNKKNYSKMYLISPSESVNHFFESVIKKECVFNEYSEKWMNSLISKMTEVNQGRTAKDPSFKNVLIILDDLGSDVNFHSSKALSIITARGRHLGISIFIAIQHLNSCPPLLRSNCDYIFCGKLSRNSLELLIENYHTGELDRKQFITMYNQSTIDYSFLVIYNNATVSNDLNLIYSAIKVPNIN